MSRKRIYKILLSDEDKKILNAKIQNKKTCKTIIRRCSILMELDENNPQHLTHAQIAKSYGVCKATISNVVSAYTSGGIGAVTKINRNPNLDLCQYFGQKKLKYYVGFLSSSSSFCCGVR